MIDLYAGVKNCIATEEKSFVQNGSAYTFFNQHLFQVGQYEPLKWRNA
jgi:hypothetical protein